MDIETAMNKLIHIGGDELALRVIELYAEHVPMRLETLLESSLNNDLDQISRMAHSIKSSAGNLGLQAVYDSANIIETTILHSKPPDHLKADINQLKTEIAQSLIDLKNWEQKIRSC